MLNLSQLINPLQKEQYQIIIKQAHVNSLIKTLIELEKGDMQSLNFRLFKDKVQLRGVTLNSMYNRKKPKEKHIGFNVSLNKKGFSENKLFFRIHKFSAYYPDKRVDILRLISRFGSFVLKRFLESVIEQTPFLSATEFHRVISFDIDYILSHIPSETTLLGKMEVLDVDFEYQNLICLISSNFMLKALILIFGTKYFTIKQLTPKGHKLNKSKRF